MGSSSSRHVSQAPEARDRGDYAAARREGAGAGVDFVDRITESQARASNGRDRLRGIRFRPGRFSSARYPEAPTQNTDLVAPLSISARRSASLKGSSPDDGATVTMERPGADQFLTSWAAAESSSSSTGSSSENIASVAESTRNIDTGRPSVGLVMEILPVSVTASETVSSESPYFRSARSNIASNSRNLWLEGHPPWNSRVGQSEENPSSLTDLPESPQQNLQAVCESTLQQHRVNEMQERLRRYAGLPPSIDIHDLERRGILSAESSGAQSQRTGSSSTSGGERNDFPFQSAPASLRAWEITEEGRLIEYRHSVYSESWERHLALHRSGLQNDRLGTSNASSSTPLTAAGRESRRNGGRRLWETLTRAASHRRTSTPMTVPVADSVVDGWTQNDDGHIDLGAFHTRSLDLEERRRRVRSQVWALQLLSNGLDAMPGFTRPCNSGGHHHGHCSCEVPSSPEDTNTRASISRIIMLAEALFEVLDEIHRQSVALSRTSVSIASLPAPDTVVDAIPIRKFSTKLREETTQCNICLVEYEEGDQMRVLPCHHEYHMACVDKWLKEVHRVCPLCRGNVCEPNSAMHLLPLST